MRIDVRVLGARLTFHSLNAAFKKILMASDMQQNGGVYFSTTTQMMQKDHLTVTSANTRNPEIHEVKVEKITNISASVKHLMLRSLQTPTPFSFKAGQWVDMFIPNVTQVGGFSITSSPALLETKGEFHLAVKCSDSPPSKWVHTDCKVDDLVKIRVGGDFFLTTEATTPKIIFIAGGVGINPLASMISMLNDAGFQVKGQQIQAVLLFSAKTNDELIFKDQFDKIANNFFHPFYFVTAEKLPNDKERSSVKGTRISAEDLKTVTTQVLGSTAEIDQISAYVCGPSDMVVTVKELLGKMSIRKVYHEDWW